MPISGIQTTVSIQLVYWLNLWIFFKCCTCYTRLLWIFWWGLLLFITCQNEILQWLVSWKWFVANWTLITLLTSYHSVWKIHHILNIYRAFSFHRLQICEFLYSVFLKKLRHKYYIYVAWQFHVRISFFTYLSFVWTFFFMCRWGISI